MEKQRCCASIKSGTQCTRDKHGKSWCTQHAESCSALRAKYKDLCGTARASFPELFDAAAKSSDIDTWPDIPHKKSATALKDFARDVARCVKFRQAMSDRCYKFCRRKRDSHQILIERLQFLATHLASLLPAPPAPSVSVKEKQQGALQLEELFSQLAIDPSLKEKERERRLAKEQQTALEHQRAVKAQKRAAACKQLQKAPPAVPLVQQPNEEPPMWKTVVYKSRRPLQYEKARYTEACKLVRGTFRLLPAAAFDWNHTLHEWDAHVAKHSKELISPWSCMIFRYPTPFHTTVENPAMPQEKEVRVLSGPDINEALAALLCFVVGWQPDYAGREAINYWLALVSAYMRLYVPPSTRQQQRFLAELSKATPIARSDAPRDTVLPTTIAWAEHLLNNNGLLVQLLRNLEQALAPSFDNYEDLRYISIIRGVWLRFLLWMTFFFEHDLP